MKQGVYTSENLEDIFKFMQLNKDIIRVDGRSGKEVTKCITAMDGGYGGEKTVFEHSVHFTQIRTHYYTKAHIDYPEVKHQIKVQFP